MPLVSDTVIMSFFMICDKKNHFFEIVASILTFVTLSYNGKTVRKSKNKK